MASTPEGKIEDYAAKLAAQHRYHFMKFVSGETGVPDRIIVADGAKVVFMELKQVNGRLSERQKLKINAIRRKGAVVYIPFSKEDVKAAFEELSTHTYQEIVDLHKHDTI